MNILVTGSSGQIGSELVPALRTLFGPDCIFCADLKSSPPVDVTDFSQLEKIIVDRHITTIYHLASLLSVASEERPQIAWQVNLGSLKNILDLAVKYKLRVFWPSSIAAFGPTTPKINVPQHTVLEPTTIYGVTKVAGELLCQYYYLKFGVDVRSVRYPGIISWRTPPSAGTTEYAVDMLRRAGSGQPFTCFLSANSLLPMLYVSDAIKATLDIMAAPAAALSVRTSYNIAAFSFSPAQLAAEISRSVPLDITYAPDFHQAIADSWPDSIDDSVARADWAWQPKYNFSAMVSEILENLKSTHAQ